MSEETITINGVLYNAKTGQPIKKSTSAKPAPRPAAKISVKQPKKVTVRQPRKITVNPAPKPVAKRKPAPSQTLNRTIVKKPQPSPRKRVAQPIAKKPIPKTRPQPKPAQRPAPKVQPARIASRGIKRPRPVQQPIQKTKPIQKPAPIEKKKIGKAPIITGICVLLLIIGIVLAYFFLPSFSVWVAGNRADVEAKLPLYTPSSYKVSGTAESSPGIVTLNYYSDSLGDGYSLTQANSNWDSEGVLENKVKPLGGNHQTLSQKGLTIYRYSTGAIWVNGGILYTITDEGKLSNEQILHIVDGI